MIIKLIPENDIEKSRMRTVEHHGVKNLFMFGIKKEKDGDLKDFHDWNGDFKFLLSNLHYFTSIITEEQNYKIAKEREAKENEIALDPKMALRSAPPMIKRGSQPDNKIVEILNPETLEQIQQETQNNTVPFTQINPPVASPSKPAPAINDGFDTEPEVEEKEDEAGE